MVPWLAFVGRDKDTKYLYDEESLGLVSSRGPCQGMGALRALKFWISFVFCTIQIVNPPHQSRRREKYINCARMQIYVTILVI